MHHTRPGGSGTHMARSAAPKHSGFHSSHHVYTCTQNTHLLTAQAHLVSRMALMNADLLAAGTGGLLVLMTRKGCKTEAGIASKG